MTTEVSFDSSSIQMLLLIGIIILMAIYFYYENYKIKNQLFEFQYKIDKLTELVYSSKNIELSQPVNIEKESEFQPSKIDSINESTGQPMNQPMNESTEQPMSESMNESMNQPMSESTEQHMNENLNDTWSDIHQQMKNIDHDNQMIDDTMEVGVPIEKNIDNKESSDLDINLDDMLKDIMIDKENVNGESGGNDGGGSGERGENDKIDYSKMTVSQLKNILIEKNLPVSGNKTKLIQRILDNNE